MREHSEQAAKRDAVEERIREPVRRATSPTPEMMVRSANIIDSASVRPRRMNRKASVTMNDGRRVRITR